MPTRSFKGLKTLALSASLAAADAAALTVSLLLSFTLRFDSLEFRGIYEQYLKNHRISFCIAIVGYVCTFYALRMYRRTWRFASLETLWSVVLGNTLGLLGLIAVQTFLDGGTFPRSVLILFWTRGIISVGGLRILMRLVNDYAQKRKAMAIRQCRSNDDPKRAVILGGGRLGVTILRAFSEDPRLHYNVIGFLDDDPLKIGTFIGNVHVLGPINHISRLVENGEVDEVIVALPEVSAENQKHILACRRAKVSVKVVPSVRDAIRGKTNIEMQDFSVEDLLKRAPRRTNVEKIGEYLTGKRVLVTGAGGSIGSELCRQIAALKPASLVLMGHGENSVFDIKKELTLDFPEMAERIYWVIASVSDEHRIRQVFNNFKPEVVFHAAAHKHVCIMESNILEAVQNNVVGTYNIANACGSIGTEKMVLISTDKAANPSSVMGATKWMCEKVLCMAARNWSTTYVTVRFGNVLGSRGSVVPIFRSQIERGGPVTVTHPEITRYFMTIPEAVRLVLQSGAVGESGDLYLLDMGEPVKIVDLARDMIRLYGLEPDVDIPIQFTGIGPGEKKHEKLISDDESIERAKWDGLFIVNRNVQFAPFMIEGIVQRMKRLIHEGDEVTMMNLMNNTVPGFAGVQHPGIAADADLEQLDEKLRKAA